VALVSRVEQDVRRRVRHVEEVGSFDGLVVRPALRLDQLGRHRADVDGGEHAPRGGVLHLGAGIVEEVHALALGDALHRDVQRDGWPRGRAPGTVEGAGLEPPPERPKVVLAPLVDEDQRPRVDDPRKARTLDRAEDGLAVHQDQDGRRRAEDHARRVVLDRLGPGAAGLGLGEGQRGLDPVEREFRHIPGQTLLEHLLVVGGHVGAGREHDLVDLEVGQRDEPVGLVHVRSRGEPGDTEVLERRRRALDRDGRSRMEARAVPLFDLRLVDGEGAASLREVTGPGR
jgi:hypothetical protein